jgi:hypothetical protein
MPFEVVEQGFAPYRRYVEGPFTYAKHAFDSIGHMGDEESQCANKLDDHPNVKRWFGIWSSRTPAVSVYHCRRAETVFSRFHS